MGELRRKIIDSFEDDFKKLESKKENLGKEREILLKKVEITEKFKENKPKNKEELKELFKVLCFDDLIFCCKPKVRPCLWRSETLLILGITDEEFIKEKERLSAELFKDKLKFEGEK